MIKQLFQRRSTSERELRPYYKKVEQINRLEPTFERYSNAELRAQTELFKRRLKEGETVQDIAIEAFATVREVSKRVLGLRHFDVQLLGGLVLLDHNVAEMSTGEGKTLVASLPSYTVALEGKGVHIVTVNDYLARRDRDLIGQIHEFLGLTVGLTIPGISNFEKKEAYQCDITYGVGTEFGFDYLRDNLVRSPEEKVQRPYHFAIIDEIDSVLIDEAKTPLIIAGKDRPSGRLYNVCALATRALKQDEHFKVDEELKIVHFTDEGITKCEEMFGIDNLFDLEHTALFHALLQSLRARILYERDVDYIVDEGEIKLIDMNTGRIMEGRSLSDGLHQAIESKEGLENTDENKTHASITIQNYFRMYPHLAGMTGTAKTEEDEFIKVYGMRVLEIPTNKKRQRIDYPDRVFMTREDQHRHLVKEVKKRHEKGQPLLIGTTSILRSEEISDLLKEAGLKHVVLNAKSVEQEADLIAKAGQKGRITIATNMAGRGTDIRLGEGVAELGGLHVIGTERNDSERIDNQLRGRSGRQGDPGSSMFIISLEDQIFRRYAKKELERIKPKLKVNEEGMITSPEIHKTVETTQRVSEGFQFQLREYNLQIESIINRQREVIYNFRDEIIEKKNVLSYIVEHIKTLPKEILDSYALNEWMLEDFDYERLNREFNNISLVPVNFKQETTETIDDLYEQAEASFSEHLKRMQRFYKHQAVEATVRGMSLHVIDNLWKEHLTTMDRIKEGLGLRQYKQEDPITEFEKDGFELFQTLFMQIKYEIARHSRELLEHMLKQQEEEKV